MNMDESCDEVCALPPALTGSALMAAADGEADEATLAHLRSCRSCADRVAQIRAVQVQLRRRLYRLHCLTTDTLVDYCQGLLDPYQRATVAHHIALCPHCSAELALLSHSAPLSEPFAHGRALPLLT